MHVNDNQENSAGHIISVGDGQIAVIAAVHGYIVATRDVKPFIAAGVPVINPWETDINTAEIAHQRQEADV